MTVPFECPLNTDLATPDEAFLAQFPLRDKLGPGARERFDINALFWREMLPYFEEFARGAEPIITKAEADLDREGLTLGAGSYLSSVKEFLRRPTPAAWTLCDSCGGAGATRDGGPCPSCEGKGFRLNWFEGPGWFED